MSNDLGYNMDNENANDEWNGEVADQPITGKIVEQISKDAMPYVTVAGCQHTRVDRVQSDEFVGCVEVTCLDCPLGWYVREPK